MEDRKKLIEKHYRAYQNHPRALSNLSRMIAGAELKNGRRQEARIYYLQALRATPLDFRSLAGLLRTIVSISQ